MQTTNRIIESPIDKRSYFIILFGIFFCSYSQYFFAGFSPAGRVLLVYGLPILWINRLCGPAIMRKAFVNSWAAMKYGFGAFGVCAVWGGLLATGILYGIAGLDPEALKLLHRPNPVLHVPPQMAWTMVWASFLVVGPAEEYIFRGFVFGGLLRLYSDRHWFFLALLSSLLFAAVHLYYVLLLGIASLVPLVEIVAIGVALSVGYYVSGGNLIVPALIHGAFDASGFIAADLSPTVGADLRAFMVLSGLAVAVFLWGKRKETALPTQSAKTG